MKTHGCRPLHLPENDATVTVLVENGVHNKISYSLKLGNELQLTPLGYRVYHAEFKNTKNIKITKEENANKGKNVDTFNIVKDKPRCRYLDCHRQREKKNDNYIYDTNEVELFHYRLLHGQCAGMWEYVPARLLIETYYNKCFFCGKAYRDSISDLRDGRKHYTRDLGTYIKTMSLQSDLKQLSEKYFVNRKEVYSLYAEAVADRDKESRAVPQPKSLGLYTLTFNKAGKTKRNYCLCVDVERQAFIGFFPWDDAKKKQDFFDSIPDIQKVSTIFVSLDDNAIEQGTQLAHKVNAKLAVERHSVLRQAHDAAELIYEAVIRKQRNKYDKKDLTIYKRDFLYYDVEEWEKNKSFLERYFQLKKFEEIKYAHGLNKIIFALYNNKGWESFAEAKVDEWVRAWKPFKKQYPQIDKFSALLEKYKGEIAAFKSLSRQLDRTPTALAEYEELLTAADNAITMLASNGKMGAYAARKAEWDYLYGHVMYGVVDRVNDDRRRQYQIRKQNSASIFKKATYVTSFNDESVQPTDIVESDAPELITNDNFAIPLRDFYYGLNMMREYPVPEETSIGISTTQIEK